MRKWRNCLVTDQFACAFVASPVTCSKVYKILYRLDHEVCLLKNKSDTSRCLLYFTGAWISGTSGSAGDCIWARHEGEVAWSPHVCVSRTYNDQGTQSILNFWQYELFTLVEWIWKCPFPGFIFDLAQSCRISLSLAFLGLSLIHIWRCRRRG